MDTKQIEDAIFKAIRARAVIAPLRDEASDDNLLPPETDFRVSNQDAFEDYVADITRDPVMARFDASFGVVSSNQLRLTTVARLLLARAINSQDVTGTVEEFRSYVEQNSAPAIAVIAISGVTVERELNIGPNIRLVPVKSLPPSSQRGLVLGESSSIFYQIGQYDCPSALVKDVEVSPVFLWPEDTEKVKKQDRMEKIISNAFDELEESRTLLALLDQRLVGRLNWIQAKYPSRSIGLNLRISATRDSGKLVSEHSEHSKIDELDLEELGEQYFKIQRSFRHNIMRVPLDRLDRAKLEYDLVHSSIDLGIALEALLLHQIESHSELAFRLALRGAWLGGTDLVERAETQKTLKEVYRLRSEAVHSGVIKRNAKNLSINKNGIEICKKLIRKTLASGCKIEWNKLVLGG